MNKLPEKIVSLSFVYEPPRLLLALKKRGFGVGKWNGFGGKMEPGETMEEAAKREIFEEGGIHALELEPAGFIHFDFDEGRPFTMEVHLFRILRYEGEPQETEEMKPQWFHRNEIPYDQMWNDDKYWLQAFLEGKKINGSFVLDADDKVISHTLEIAP